MAIHVVCTKCRKRFKVDEKFAGMKGPCPNCKAQIQIPKLDEQVVIHGPDEGPKNAQGQLVLKPLSRMEATFSPPVIIATVVGSLALLAIAWIVGNATNHSPPTFLLALGALIVAPPVVLGGYTFLHDDDLEPYAGTPLYIRAGICSVLYAALWGLYSAAAAFLLQGFEMQIYHYILIIPPFVIAGATISFATLDLEPTVAGFHYGMYLLVTAALRLVMGMNAF